MSNFITLAFKNSIVNGGFIRAVDHINSVSIVIKDLRTPHPCSENGGLTVVISVNIFEGQQ